MDKSFSDENSIGPAETPGGHAYALKEGDSLGQYKVIKPLGAGGMGEVYLVENIQMHKRYALKILPRSLSRDPQFVGRFKAGARVMADLSHPGIVKVHAMGEEGGLYYLVMDYVEGPDGEPRTLDDVLGDRTSDAGRRLGEKEVKEMALQICDTLEYAYTSQDSVIHLDLKPSNILLDDKGRVHVSDFGLAKVVGESYLKSVIERSVLLSIGEPASTGEESTECPHDRETSSRSTLDTYDSMSPEQKVGLPTSSASNIYALGMLLYRMLTGERADGWFKRPSAYGCAKGWDAVIERCLQTTPQDRYASVAALKSDIQRVGRGVSLRRRLVRVAGLILLAGAAYSAYKASDGFEAGEEAYRAAREVLERAVQKAEQESAPRLKISAEADGREVEATIRRDDREWTAPHTIAMEGGESFFYEVSYENDVTGKRWDTAEVQGTVDWLGAKSVRIVLEQRAEPYIGENWTSPATGMEFVWVQEMDMWVGKYEVTNSKYREKVPGHDSGEWRGHSLNGDRKPVVRVNFGEAKAYAEWLTEQDQGVLGGLRYRLPSEDEWQAFAQVGNGREYPWGNQWPPPSGVGLNYSDRIEGYNSDHRVTAPVDELWENPWGLYGVGGNAWEATARDSTGSSFGAWRGASWNLRIQDFLRCSYRLGFGGSTRGYDLGFRLVLAKP